MDDIFESITIPVVPVYKTDTTDITYKRYEIQGILSLYPVSQYSLDGKSKRIFGFTIEAISGCAELLRGIPLINEHDYKSTSLQLAEKSVGVVGSAEVYGGQIQTYFDINPTQKEIIEQLDNKKLSVSIQFTGNYESNKVVNGILYDRFYTSVVPHALALTSTPAISSMTIEKVGFDDKLFNAVEEIVMNILKGFSKKKQEIMGFSDTESEKDKTTIEETDKGDEEGMSQGDNAGDKNPPNEQPVPPNEQLAENPPNEQSSTDSAGLVADAVEEALSVKEFQDKMLETLSKHDGMLSAILTLLSEKKEVADSTAVVGFSSNKPNTIIGIGTDVETVSAFLNPKNKTQSSIDNNSTKVRNFGDLSKSRQK